MSAAARKLHFRTVITCTNREQLATPPVVFVSRALLPLRGHVVSRSSIGASGSLRRGGGGTGGAGGGGGGGGQPVRYGEYRVVNPTIGPVYGCINS
jgi:hypothetical protein